jgi:peptidylprolyl isomerase
MIKSTGMQQAKKGDTVKVHYHGRLANGETFDKSEGREPLEFEIGSGMVIKGFDEGVAGMSIGEKKTINIPFDEAYGPINPDMVIEVPKDQFPQGMEVEVGMPLGMSDGKGRQFQVVVAEIKEEVVLLDANHPLAGQDLIFDLELVSIGNPPLIIVP